MNVQNRIRQLMEERGWTDYRLAKESGLSHSTISNMFKRNNAPSIPTLEVVCQAFARPLYSMKKRCTCPLSMNLSQSFDQLIRIIPPRTVGTS